jgi:hypothetical protein
MLTITYNDIIYDFQTVNNVIRQAVRLLSINNAYDDSVSSVFEGKRAEGMFDKLCPCNQKRNLTDSSEYFTHELALTSFPSFIHSISSFKNPKRVLHCTRSIH